MEQPTPRKRSALRDLLRLGLRLALTGGVFAYLFSKIDPDELGRSLTRIPTLTLLGAMAAYYCAAMTGMIRWRLLLRAYGAAHLPTWGAMHRWYMISTFYNLLPGAVGGDVYRGVATRHVFADGAATRSVGVVFVERVFGLSGLLILTAITSLTSPAFRDEVLYYSALGLVAAAGALVAIAVGRRLANLLPGWLGRTASSLPSIEHPTAFLGAIAISIGTHLVISLAGHLLITSLAPQVRLNQSFVIFPLGTLAAYFPLTFAGAGARDAALAVLFAQIGVARADALATSLSLLVCHIVVSSIGGLLQARAPLLPTASSAGVDRNPS